MELRLRKIKIKNKNSFADFIGLFFAITVIFGIAIFVLILYNSYNEHIKDNLNDALTSSTPVDSSANVTEILDQTGTGVGRLNPLFPFLIVGVFGFVLVSALMAKSHPAFLFIGLIVLGVAIIIAAVFSNVYDAIAEKDEFTDTNDEFSIMGLFLSNLPTITLILFVAIGLILYAFTGKSGGGGGQY